MLEAERTRMYNSCIQMDWISFHSSKNKVGKWRGSVYALHHIQQVRLQAIRMHFIVWKCGGMYMLCNLNKTMFRGHTTFQCSWYLCVCVCIDMCLGVQFHHKSSLWFSGNCPLTGLCVFSWTYVRLTKSLLHHQRAAVTDLPLIGLHRATHGQITAMCPSFVSTLILNLDFCPALIAN